MRLPCKTIMAAIDFSDSTNAVLSCGVMLGKKYRARLLPVHVTVDVNTLLEYNETTLDVDALQQENLDFAETTVRDLIQGLDVETEVVLSRGEPADEISRLARERDVDLVVTATHGRSGFKRLLIGSVTEKLLKTLHCPLLALHAGEHRGAIRNDAEIKKLLVGCDFSPDSKLALDFGLNLAREFQAELHLCHVTNPSFYPPEIQGSKELQDRLERQLDRLVPEACRDGCTAQTVLLEGEPYLELMTYADQQGIDMIVVGIRGHTLWEKLMVGSTTDRLIRHTTKAVLAVRQK